MSERYACASRRRETLLRALHVDGDETILDGVDHDEIDLDGQDRTEFIEEAEASVHEIVWMRGAELDEQVQVALSGSEVVEAFHPETSARLSNSRALVFDCTDRVAPPRTMAPRATAALPARPQIGSVVHGGVCMDVASVTVVGLVQGAGDRRAQIEAALTLGASPRQCTASVTRRSVRLAVVPFIDNTKTEGIVFLPGAMTGMIPACDDPLQAVRLQLVVVFMLLVAALTATLVSRPPPGARSWRRCGCGGWGRRAREPRTGGAAAHPRQPPNARGAGCPSALRPRSPIAVISPCSPPLS